MFPQKYSILSFLAFIIAGYFIQVNCSCEDGPGMLTWIVEYGPVAPDNYIQPGMLINGKFPGPTLIVHPNSRLVVKVINKTPEWITMHWHGLHQEHSVDADGVSFVNQDNILPNDSYTYCIHIGSQTGTFMYHGHRQVSPFWLLGPLIVQDRGHQEYDEERIIFFSELLHQPISDFLNAVLNGGPRPETKSLLINGRSYGLWEENNGDGEGYTVIKVKKGATYRFRVINLTVQRFLRFYIPGHQMTIIEMDGIDSEPVDVEYLQIHTGQRYSVLVTMDQEVDNYWMDLREIPGPGLRNGAAILHYEGARDPTPLRKTIREGTTPKIILDEWVTDLLRPARGSHQTPYPVPTKVDRNLVMDFWIVVRPSGAVNYFLNGRTYVQPQSPWLFQVRNHTNITDNTQVFEILTGQNVQVILQSRGIDGCSAHPWHLHGRNFYVVAHGPGLYNEERDRPIIDRRVREGKGTFQYRDVFVQYPHGQRVDGETGAGGVVCGWYALRFKATNPGVWINHCHIIPHMIEGEKWIFWEHTPSNPWLIGE